MKGLITYLTIFMVFCIIGWIIELLYRSHNLKHLVNPGFMVGCVLPIYGFGSILLYIISKIDINTAYVWQGYAIKIVISSILMTAIEFLAGYFIFKIYHNRLWDYTKKFGNVKGFICPEFSLYWAIAAALFILFLDEPIEAFCTLVFDNSYLWLILGMVYGVFFVDLAYSLRLMNKIKIYAERFKTTYNFETLKVNIRNRVSEINNKRISNWNEFKLRHNLFQAFDNKGKVEDNLKKKIDYSDKEKK